MARGERWPISAFGDEIAPDLEEQVAVLRRNEVGALELRTAWSTNVVELSIEELERARTVPSAAGIAVSAIGSPVGKTPVDGDFDEELARLRAALTAAKTLGTSKVRIFSFFIPDGRYAESRDEVLRRMSAFAGEAAAQDVMDSTMLRQRSALSSYSSRSLGPASRTCTFACRRWMGPSGLALLLARSGG